SSELTRWLRQRNVTAPRSHGPRAERTGRAFVAHPRRIYRTTELPGASTGLPSLRCGPTLPCLELRLSSASTVGLCAGLSDGTRGESFSDSWNHRRNPALVVDPGGGTAHGDAVQGRRVLGAS